MVLYNASLRKSGRGRALCVAISDILQLGATRWRNTTPRTGPAPNALGATPDPPTIWSHDLAPAVRLSRGSQVGQVPNHSW